MKSNLSIFISVAGCDVDCADLVDIEISKLFFEAPFARSA